MSTFFSFSGCLIAAHGTGVCGSKPSEALKEMAKQIADRDTSVRNAALNALTETYFKEGEKLYKMIGNLPEKVKEWSYSCKNCAAVFPSESRLNQHLKSTHNQSTALFPMRKKFSE